MTDMTGNPAAAGYQRAPLGTRFVAFLIDVVLVGIPVAIIAAIVARILGLGVVDDLISLAAGTYILGFGSGLSGFTPGKRQQGAMLLSTETFRPVGGGVGAARYLLAGFLTVLCLADIIALVASGRRISDRILNTDVYHVQPGEIMPIFPNGKPF